MRSWRVGVSDQHWQRDYTPRLRGEAQKLDHDHDQQLWHWNVMLLFEGNWRYMIAGVASTQTEAMNHADKVGSWYASQLQ